MKKIISIIASVVLCLSTILSPNCVALNEKNDDDKANSERIGNSYNQYVSDYTQQAENGKLKEINVCFNSSSQLKENSLLNGIFDAQANGWYELYFNYVSVVNGGFAVDLKIDGKLPFEEASKIVFPSFWTNDGNIRFDNSGNEISAEQMLYTSEVSTAATEHMGNQANPFRLYIKKGKHKFSAKILYGAVNIKSVVFIPVSDTKNYEDILHPNLKEVNGKTIILEGEKSFLSNKRSLIALSDKSNPQVSPANAVKGKLNYIGGSNWAKSGDTIYWKMNVENSGYYRLGFHYRQSDKVGSASYRCLKIDGKIPFTQAGNIKFTYSPQWKYYEFGEKEPYLFYLDEGEHILSLSVTGGEMIPVYNELKSITESMSKLYVDITMIIGESVDIQRSYELFKQIPDFNKRLKENIDALANLKKTINATQEYSSGTTVSIVDNAIEVLKNMLEKPYSAHKYKSSFYSSYTNLSAEMGTLLEMPLSLDTIYFIPYGSKSEIKKVSFFKKIIFSLKRFIASFANDYRADTDGNENNKGITLWVNWGRDQAQALNNVILNKFQPEYKIPVYVKVVNATLIQAILSGKGPDCMLNMERSEPVNLAMRGGLVDLSKYEGFENCVKLFHEGATVPYQYKGGTYALPDTQSFDMLFVRTDILSELGIKIPKTWDDFIDALTLLQRNNLQVYLPQTLTETFLYQNNLSVYNSSLSATDIINSKAISAMSKYYNFFTDYKVPTTMDFYNRFRIGSAPVGVAPYTLATQLMVAAPEIDGKWMITTIPGFADKNGEINNVSAGGGTGCGITEISENKEAAWKFIKWWVSEEAQLNYSNELETMIGPLGRLAVSNKKALEGMSWEPDKLTAIKQQWGKVVETPQIPGSYYLTRSLEQIFWNVVELHSNPKDVIIEWADIADMEIERKTNEYADR